MVRVKYSSLHQRKWDALFAQWESAVIESGSFDHRSLQALHDLIAAQYRKYLLDDMPDATAMRKKDGWCDYFKNEAFEFLQEEEFVREFMIALSGGSDVGYDAEEAMFLSLLEKYGVLMPAVVCD